jgi:hypothetical protein
MQNLNLKQQSLQLTQFQTAQSQMRLLLLLSVGSSEAACD